MPALPWRPSLVSGLPRRPPPISAARSGAGHADPRVAVVRGADPERRAVADPLRGRRGPVPGQRVDAAGVLRAQPLERLPPGLLRPQHVARLLQALSRLAVLLQLHADLALALEVEREHQVLDA